MVDLWSDPAGLLCSYAFCFKYHWVLELPPVVLLTKTLRSAVIHIFHYILMILHPEKGDHQLVVKPQLLTSVMGITLTITCIITGSVYSGMVVYFLSSYRLWSLVHNEGVANCLNLHPALLFPPSMRVLSFRAKPAKRLAILHRQRELHHGTLWRTRDVQSCCRASLTQWLANYYPWNNKMLMIMKGHHVCRRMKGEVINSFVCSVNAPHLCMNYVLQGILGRQSRSACSVHRDTLCLALMPSTIMKGRQIWTAACFQIQYLYRVLLQEKWCTLFQGFLL